MMLGASESYPYPHFPHTTALDISYKQLNSEFGIVMNVLKEIKWNQFDDFCILTMKDYVEFNSGNIAPLCLPDNPYKDYHEGGSVEMYGFGYDDSVDEDMATHAKGEKEFGQMVANSRELKRHATPVISRQDCLREAFNNLTKWTSANLIT